MVKIIGYKGYDREDGTTFCLLELQGGVKLAQSKTTGQFYATAKKAMMSTTFDENTCESLIGTELQGEIVKQDVEAYSYVSKDTGEQVTLTHRWVFQPSETV